MTYESYRFSESQETERRPNGRNNRVIPGDEIPDGAVIFDPGIKRASDAERTAFRVHLEEVHRLGYIDQPEYEVRLAAGEEAKTAAKLQILLADLPPLPDPDAERNQKKLTSRARKWWADHADSPGFRYPLWAVSLLVAVLLITVGSAAAARKHASIMHTVFGVALPVTTGVILAGATVLWAIVWSAIKYG